MKISPRQRGQQIWECVRKSSTLNQIKGAFSREVSIQLETTSKKYQLNRTVEFASWRTDVTEQEFMTLERIAHLYAARLRDVFWYLDIFEDIQFCFELFLRRHVPRNIPSTSHIPARIKYSNDYSGKRPSAISVEVSPFAQTTEIREFIASHSKELQGRQAGLRAAHSMDHTRPRRMRPLNRKRDELIQTLWACDISELRLLTPYPSNFKDILISRALQEILGIQVSDDLVRKIAGKRISE